MTNLYEVSHFCYDMSLRWLDAN